MVEEKSIGQIYSECCDWMLFYPRLYLLEHIFPLNIKPGFDNINSQKWLQ